MDFNQIGKIQKVKECVDKFRANHPKFPMFINAVARDALKEGTLIEINVTTPEGQEYKTNVRIKAEDMELMRTLQEMSR